MLTKQKIKYFTDLQARYGKLPLGDDLITIPDAATLTGKTFRSVSLMRNDYPGVKFKGNITWWIVGSVIMLDKPSLLEVALARGWIEEVLDE